MLNIVFLILMIIVIYKAIHGELAETLCNFSMVVGVICAAIGIVVAVLGKSHNPAMLILNIAVLVYSVCLKKVARHFVRLYEDKVAREEEMLRADMERYVRTEANAVPIIYNDDNFDDPELRFGSGGYTENKQ